VLPSSKKEILDLIAYRANAKKDPGLSQGIEFFAFLRNLTVDGFFTSKIGTEYLKYIGNTFLASFRAVPQCRECNRFIASLVRLCVPCG